MIDIYNEATSWIDFMLSQVPSGGILQGALRRIVGFAEFFAKFEKNLEKIGKNFVKLQPVNCNRITATGKFHINYEILH